jgi:formate dehydrogenase iron-sulfur subunit
VTERSGKPFPTGRLIDGKPRAILFDAVKCIGCRQCVQACKDWNDHPRTSLYELSSTTWITMEPPVLEGLSTRWARNSCMHCESPICAAVCPVEAITKYDEGPVVINPEVCIGCEYCIYACPWGALSKEDIRGVISKDKPSGKAAKCTMCSDRVAHDQSPFCVQACPVEALDFGLKGEIYAKAEERAGQVDGYVYGDKEAGGTQVVYVLKDRKEDYHVRNIDPTKYPNHRIPLSLMLRDLLTLRCGFKGKLRALYLAVIHPSRLLYRYAPWRSPGM